MDVGFTGSRRGMMPLAKQKVQALLITYFVHNNANTFHHGDCVGSDETAFNLALYLGYQTIAYPASDVPFRFLATTDSEIIREAAPALERNQFIVSESDVMIAAVQGFAPNAEQRRSGTWATIRHAMSCDVPIWLVNPMGQAQFYPIKAHRDRLEIASINWSM